MEPNSLSNASGPKVYHSGNHEGLDDLYEKLQALLRQIFQYDKQDLDFGIYRLINHKRAEIGQFLDRDLPDIIESEISRHADIFKGQLQAARGELYAHLIQFFSRYYDHGNFSIKRGEKYSLPYAGEETFFHWANLDQYYIKTRENFGTYSFSLKDFHVKFALLAEETTIEKGNIKGAHKKFFIFSHAQIKTPQEIALLFGYRGLKDSEQRDIGRKRVAQKHVNAYNYRQIVDYIPKAQFHSLYLPHINKGGKNSEKSQLEWHLEKFTSRNTEDYFIHKRLRHFLGAELNIFIAQEILNADGLSDRGKLEEKWAQAQLVKAIGAPIIANLAQIEDFAKQLWEKPKFVVSTDYLITLDRVDPAFYPEIASCTAQLDEWDQLNMLDLPFLQAHNIDPTSGKMEGGKTETMVTYLSHNQNLPLNTALLPTSLTQRILQSIDKFEDKITGILIKSDNYHALQLLQNKYRSRIKCCYIDPPYNAGSNKIVYKNTFKHSSWLSLMHDRIALAQHLMRKDDGIFIVAIDENEQERLGLLLDQIFDPSEYIKDIVVVRHNPRGIQGNTFSYSHEYAYFIIPKGVQIPKKVLEKAKAKPLMKTGSESSRSSAKSCFYPIYLKNGKYWKTGAIPEDDFHPEGAEIHYKDQIIELWPLCSQGKERKWRYKPESLEKVRENIFITEKSDGSHVIMLKKHRQAYKTIWTSPRYNAAEYGSTLLKNILPGVIFSFPKSLYTVKDCLDIGMEGGGWVVDFFAGSATTAHAVMAKNKQGDPRSKFILVEMGSHFNTVILPRVQKIIYSDRWTNGKPTGESGTANQIIKYQNLEQFEDSWANIQFPGANNNAVISSENHLMYIPDFESETSPIALNLQSLSDPFEYSMIFEDNFVQKHHDIDLFETFLYLTGIWVDSYADYMDGRVHYHTMIGRKHRVEGQILVIWRNIPEPFDLSRDRSFINQNIIKSYHYAEVFVNGNSALPNAKSIDSILTRWMSGQKSNR